MPEVSNPYSFDSPIGASLRKLGQTLMSGPDEASRLVHAEQAMKLKRENENITALGDVFSRYGQPGFDRNAAMNLAIRGGYKPDELAAMERYGAANTYGATDPRTTNAFVGAGGSYSNTAPAFQETQAGLDRRNAATIAEQRYQFDNKPQVIGTDTGPIITRQSESYGKPAVEDLGKVKGNAARVALNSPGGLDAASQATKVFIGADKDKQQTPRNYLTKDGQTFQTYDGITDARTGQPLPAGMIASVQGTPDQSGLRPNVQGKLQEADIENQKFRTLLNFTRQKAAASAGNFGVAGAVKGLAQDVSQVGQNIAEGLGYKGVQEAVEAAKQKAIANGVDPGALPGLFNFDPTLPSLHTASDLLVYQAASALAGQQGRSVSDKDVKLFRDIVGDPREWTGNQQKYLSKLDTIEQILNQNQGVLDQNLRRGAPSAAAPAAPGAAPSPNPPAAPGAPQTQMPPNARQAPDGNFYVPDPNRPGKYLQVQP